MNEAQIRAMQIGLMNCGEVRSKLRQALSTIAAWCDPVEADVSTEAELRERVKLVHQLAADMKDFEL